MKAQSLTDAERKLQIYLTHRPALVDYVVSILGSRAWAEDVVQEAFLRLSATNTVQLRSITDPVAYLYRIVRNLALDWGRHHSAARIADGTTDQLENVPMAAASPEQLAIDRDELRIVAAALAELPERTQLVFRLHRLNGLTLQDIAEQQKISVTLVHQLIHKALAHCADRLGALDERAE